LASRLESATKQYHAGILISEFTRAKLRGTYRMRDVDLVVVKGKTEPVGLYEVLDYHTEATFPNLMDVVNQFNAAVSQFRKGDFVRAQGYFNEALKANPDDALSTLYLKRCDILQKNPPKDWNGVWVLESK
jgi:adenylate cyclase